MESTTFTRPERGALLELRVESLAYGGNGIARLEAPADGRGGYVVFVSGAIPGDLVRAVVTKRKRGYAEARTLEVLEPSPERIAPLADHPGAPWQVLPYERQLAVKHEQVRDALTRIGKLEGFVLDDIVPAVEQWRYRNKLEYSFGTAADGTLVCGFHAPGSWHEIVPVDRLPARLRGFQPRARPGPRVVSRERPAGDGPPHAHGPAAQPRRARGSAHGRAAGADRDRARRPRHVVARGAPSTARASCGRAPTRSPRARSAATRRSSPARPRCRRRSVACSSRSLRSRSFRRTRRWPRGCTAIAAELADLKGWERVFDLYCGIGTVGLSVAARAGEVWGLEIVEPAVADAIANAKRNEIRNAKFFAGDVRLALRELVEEASRPDVCMIDPPRAGLSQKVVRRIIEAAPRRIVYISCNPTTLAPNAAQLVEAGYALRRVVPVDMFPQTPHIECVAVLDRV